MNFHTVALLLVLLPPGESPPAESSPSCPLAFQALKDTCHLLELFDRAGAWSNYHAEIGWAQRACRRAWGCPPLSDAERLPPMSLVQDRLAFAARHLDWLETQQLAHPWLDLDDWRRDACERWRWWSLACQSRTLSSDYASRRVALGEARALIGCERWFVGDWPVWVPVERFRRVP